MSQAFLVTCMLSLDAMICLYLFPMLSESQVHLHFAILLDQIRNWLTKLVDDFYNNVGLGIVIQGRGEFLLVACFRAA